MRFRARVPILALTYDSRFFPPNLANDSRATSLADGIRFVLCDAIMEYAGHKGVAVGTETSGHDTVLSNSSLVAQYAREVYVSK